MSDGRTRFQPPGPLTRRARGLVLNTRPVFQRFRNTPPIRLAIAIRWLAWLACGWPLTTIPVIALVALVSMQVPLLAGVAGLAAVWLVSMDRHQTIAALIVIVSVGGLGRLTWSHGEVAPQALAIVVAMAWAWDLLLAVGWGRFRLHRWWCELRRGLPMRYAIVAAKSTRIQGAIDGEEQLASGNRPILDHPAVGRLARFEANTAVTYCTVPPGRNASALQDVLTSVAASFVRVVRMDLVFTDDFTTYGFLVVTFDSTTRPGPRPGRGRRIKPVASPPHGVWGRVKGTLPWTGKPAKPAAMSGETVDTSTTPSPTLTFTPSENCSWNGFSTPATTNKTSPPDSTAVKNGHGQTPTDGATRNADSLAVPA